VRPLRGMTLIEITVALFIVSIMMTFIGTIYVGAMRIRSRTQEVSELTATARAALDLVRRDLTGAFPRAAETYQFDPPGYTSGEEFHWEAPIYALGHEGDPAYITGFRRVSFVAAMDGSRRTDDPMRPYEYAVVSWAVRGGALFRQVGIWKMGIKDEDLPPAAGVWNACPDVDDTDSKGVGIGEFIYSDDTAPLVDVGTYRGTAYIKTDPSTDPPTMTLLIKDSVTSQPIAVTVTVGFEEGRAVLPSWASKFSALGEKIVTSSVTFDLYAQECPDGKVVLGSNESGVWMYFVMVEPLGWSLGEEAQSLVFYPPASYGLAADRDGDGAWEDGEAGGTADGIWTGPVPRYADVHLTISDPKHQTGRRRFGQRITIPTGEVP